MKEQPFGLSFLKAILENTALKYTLFTATVRVCPEEHYEDRPTLFRSKFGKIKARRFDT